jgi:hypothetical protein
MMPFVDVNCALVLRCGARRNVAGWRQRELDDPEPRVNLLVLLTEQALPPARPGVVFMHAGASPVDIQEAAKRAALIAVNSASPLWPWLLRYHFPRVLDTSLPIHLSVATRNLCIVSFPQDLQKDVAAALRALLRSLRAVREPLLVCGALSLPNQKPFQSAVSLGNGIFGCDTAGDWAAVRADYQLDALLLVPDEGYDVFPFLRAMDLFRAGGCAEAVFGPCGPFVTKLHSKSDHSWRNSLCRAAYVRPRASEDSIVAGACCALFEPSDDLLTATWALMHSQQALRFPPQICTFCAGTIFTTRAEYLWRSARDLLRCAPATPKERMKTGASGQVEHVIERYLGLLTLTERRVSII